MKILQPDRVTDFAFGKHRVKRDVIEVQLFHVGTTLKRKALTTSSTYMKAKCSIQC